MARLMRTRLLVLGVSVCVALLGWPSRGGALGDAYRIGVDDILEISVWDNNELDQGVFVRPDGKISLRLLGEVHAAGRTVDDLAKILTEMYSQTVKGAHVMVGVKEIRSRSIFFVGGVARPGPMQLTQELTLLQAIATAGGVATAADIENAFVLRRDRKIAVNLALLIQTGDVKQNIKLEPGDTIVVPFAQTVYVQGEVKAPTTLKFSKGLTVIDAIAQAGGVTQLAAPKRVTVIRSNGANRERIRVDLDAMMTAPEKAPDMPLHPSDIVIVPQRLF